jgi:hypothetical protein
MGARATAAAAADTAHHLRHIGDAIVVTDPS